MLKYNSKAHGAQLIAYYLRQPPGSSTYRILPPRTSPAGNHAQGKSLQRRFTKFFTGKTGRFFAQKKAFIWLGFMVFIDGTSRGTSRGTPRVAARGTSRDVPGRLSEVVCDKLSFREARGGSITNVFACGTV